MKFLKISKKASEETRKLLKANIIGTPSQSMVYQHRQVEEKLNHIKDPYYVSLYLRNGLVGTCCFCKREVLENDEPITAFYIRYFTFRDSFRSDARKKVHQSRNNLLKKEIGELLNGREFDQKKPHIYYAYIDPDNIRSLNLTQEFDFDAVGMFHTVFFSRFFPKKSRHVSRLKEDEKLQISEWLKRAYGNHHFFSDENIFYQNGYYVLKSKGEIVAGIQATAEKWGIYELPGSNGKLLLSIVSKLPILRRLFSKDFQFLSVEAMLCKPGYEQDLETLISDVLARNKVSTAVMCLDPKSREYKVIKSLDCGIMGKMAKEKRLMVIARSLGMERPSGGVTYVSAFDVM